MPDNCAEYSERIGNYIDNYHYVNNRLPSVGEIADALGISHTDIYTYLAPMMSEGLLEYRNGEIIDAELDSSINDDMVLVPVLGRIACGVPKYAEGNIEEFVRMPVSVFGQGDFYLLTATGESMIEAGIDDGDQILIRKQDYAEEGDIVVALMEDEATLKRYYPEPEFCRVRLHPENRDMSDIYVDNCIIQGVAVKAVKDLM